MARKDSRFERCLWPVLIAEIYFTRKFLSIAPRPGLRRNELSLPSPVLSLNPDIFAFLLVPGGDLIKSAVEYLGTFGEIVILEFGSKV